MRSNDFFDDPKVKKPRERTIVVDQNGTKRPIISEPRSSWGDKTLFGAINDVGRQPLFSIRGVNNLGTAELNPVVVG